MFRSLIECSKDFLLAANRAYECGIQTGSGGNISTRIKNTETMFVKPSGETLAGCNLENLVITDFDGNVIEGENPTQERYLHGKLYERYSHIGGIVHTHSPWSIAVSDFAQELPLITKHSELKFKIPIPIIDVMTSSVDSSEIDKVFNVIDKAPFIPGFILKGHGIVAMSSSAKKACEIAELIEETAQIYYLNRTR